MKSSHYFLLLSLFASLAASVPAEDRFEDERPVFLGSFSDNLAQNATGNATDGEEGFDVDTVYKDSDSAMASPVLAPASSPSVEGYMVDAEAPVVAPTVAEPTATPTFKEGDAPVVFKAGDISQPVFSSPVAPPPISRASSKVQAVTTATTALVLVAAYAGL